MKRKMGFESFINIFIAIAWIYFFTLIFIGFHRFPILFVAFIVSWIPLFLLIGIYGIVIGVKSDRFLQGHYFELWKRTKSHSLLEKLKAQREIRNLGLLDSIKSSWFQTVVTFLSLIWVIGAFSILIFITIHIT
jgi:hypothetical protein